MEVAEKKLVGVEIVNKSIEIEGQDLVGSVTAHHVGTLGSLELTLKGKFELVPLANKAIDGVVDFIEKKIPGDQSLAAEAVKATLKSYLGKIKF
jgi:hypothetical protein